MTVKVVDGRNSRLGGLKFTVCALSNDTVGAENDNH